MLPRDKDGVVDAELKVYGTNNLRVADLSIIPMPLCTHVQCKYLRLGSSTVLIHALISYCVLQWRERRVIHA